MSALRVHKVTAYDCRCERCGHKWRALKLPKACARCKQRLWNIPKGELPLGRPPKPKKCEGSGRGLIPGDLVTSTQARCDACGKLVTIMRGHYARHLPPKEGR